MIPVEMSLAASPPFFVRGDRFSCAEILYADLLCAAGQAGRAGGGAVRSPRAGWCSGNVGNGTSGGGSGIATGGVAGRFEQGLDPAVTGHAAGTGLTGALHIPDTAGGLTDDRFDDARFGDLQTAAEDVVFGLRGGGNHREGFP